MDTLQGAAIDIMPSDNWYGETLVTITVSDAVNTHDSTSASFMVTVVSDGVEYGCTDSSATNFDSKANTDDGSCAYEVGTTEPPKVEKSSSGSMAWLLLLTPFLLFRKRVK
ncbi:hypothetical protein [Pseudoalteromonas sp. GB56]